MAALTDGDGGGGTARRDARDLRLRAAVQTVPSGKRNIKLLLEYDGCGYHGWQRQAGSLSIQEVIESRLGVMLGERVGIRASGRTDAGVHAKGQVVNFCARTKLTADQILKGLNSLLPRDIAVLDAEEADRSFHARFSAVSKVYEYHILNRQVPSALLRNYVWFVRGALSLGPMEECLERICGLNDFSAFMASGSEVSSTSRNMFRAELERIGADRLKFTYEADGFLRHMVRNLTGTIVEVGKGKKSTSDFERIMRSGDRRQAGMTAPGHGLYLVSVNYGQNGRQSTGGTNMKLSERIGRIKPSATLAINAKANELKRNGVRIINFGVGEPDFDTPQNIRNAGVESIGRGMTRYTAVGGINELKDAVCATIKADYGISYGRENVLISCGGKHAIYNLFMTLLDPGDEVIVPSPYWVSYPDMINLADARPIVVGCSEKDGFILRPETLEKAITPKTRLLILNSPSNPTGKYYGPDELKALAEVLLRHENVMIVSDDIYYRILFGGRKWVSLGMVEEKLRERIFIINGVSKSYCMTGWRIGYLVGDPEVIKAATDFQSQVTSNAASISQWAGVEALSGDQKPSGEMAQVFEDGVHAGAGTPCPACPVSLVLRPMGPFTFFQISAPISGKNSERAQ